MHEYTSQQERDATRSAEAAESQELQQYDPSPYDEFPTPYIPLPAAPSVQKEKATPEQDSPPHVPITEKKERQASEAAGPLVVLIVTGMIGSVLGLVAGGNMLLWAGIGVLLGGVVVLCLSLSERGWNVLDVGVVLSSSVDVFDCCQVTTIFLIGTFFLMGGLIFAHNRVLLMTGAGLLTAMIIAGWGTALLRRVARREQTRSSFLEGS